MRYSSGSKIVSQEEVIKEVVSRVLKGQPVEITEFTDRVEVELSKRLHKIVEYWTFSKKKPPEQRVVSRWSGDGVEVVICNIDETHEVVVRDGSVEVFEIDIEGYEVWVMEDVGPAYIVLAGCKLKNVRRLKP